MEKFKNQIKGRNNFMEKMSITIEKLNPPPLKKKELKSVMIVGSALMICYKFIPFLKEHKRKSGEVIAALMKNKDYCRDLVDCYNGQVNVDMTISCFIESLHHDISGLIEEDPHFVPRLSRD